MVLIGVHDGWRWVFLVNVFVGAAELPVAMRILPRRHDHEEHSLDTAGNLLLTAVLVLLLVPLVEGRTAGWPLWSWIVLALSLPAAAMLAWWVIGTALFGSGSKGSGPSGITPSLVHTAQTATAVHLTFILAAWCCAFGLPSELGAGRSSDDR